MILTVSPRSPSEICAYYTQVVYRVPPSTIPDTVQESLQRIADKCCTWFLRNIGGREILVYGICECLYHTNILEFSSLMTLYGDPILSQSLPGETGQLMGINTSTLAWEVFYESFLYRVQVSGVSIMNYQSTLVLFGTRNKHLSEKEDHNQRE